MVAPLIIGAAIAGGASYFGQRSANKANREEARTNRAFQERMSNTQWQRGVEDMRAAGINPALAYSQGPASSPGGSLSAKQESSIGAGASSAVSAAQASKSIQLMDAQIAKVEGEAMTSQAEGKLSRAREFLLTNLTMPWDGSDEPSMLLMDMLRNEYLQSKFSAEQTRNLSTISGAAAAVSANLSPALKSFSAQAGRGLSSISDVSESTEKFFSGRLMERLRQASHLRQGRRASGRKR